MQEWDISYPTMGDKENSKGDQGPSSHARFDNDDYAYDYFVSVRMEAHDQWAADKKATFVDSLKPLRTPDLNQSSHATKLRQDRVKALWEGLRRVYFDEAEGEPALEDELSPETTISLQESNHARRGEIAELMDRLRRRPRIPSQP